MKTARTMGTVSTMRTTHTLRTIHPLQTTRALLVGVLCTLGAATSLTTAAGATGAGVASPSPATAGTAATGHGERPDLAPGTWEVTVVLTTEGQPARPPITSTQCLKAEDTRDPRAFAGAMQKHSGGP